MEFGVKVERQGFDQDQVAKFKYRSHEFEFGHEAFSAYLEGGGGTGPRRSLRLAQRQTTTNAVIEELD